MRLRWVALALLASACDGAGHRADWSLRFEDEAVAARSVLVEAAVLDGGCEGEPIYRAEVPGPPPPVLPAGRYGLAGVARDGACATIARGCVQVELPLPGAARVVVPLVATAEGPTCAASACRAGRCDGPYDAGAPAPHDAGAEDATVPDAGLPDAALPDAAVACDLEREGRCFRRVATAEPWDAAERACAAWGGHLVRYDDATEESAIEGQLGTGHWIGLSDAADEGVFRWADGSAPSFTRWQPGAPSDTPPWRDCVEHTPSGWLDARCSDPRPYVCAR